MGAVAERADRIGERQQGNQQQHDRGEQNRPRQRPPAVVVHPGHDDHGNGAGQGTGQLLQEKPEGALLERGGGVEAGDAEHRQHRGDHHKQPGFPAEITGIAGRGGGHHDSTISRNRRPRAS